MDDLVQKALELIEEISSSIGCVTQKEVTVNRKDIDDIYMFAHVALGRCENKHKDWVDKLNKTHKELKDRGIL